METCFGDKLATGKYAMGSNEQFDMDQRLTVLDYLIEHKGKGLNLIAMKADVREASFKRIIAKNLDLV
jgi:hypothetical protein